MKATEFVKKFGIEFAKNWFAKNVGDTPTHQKYVNIVNGEPKGIISTASHGGFHVDELKRLIESHELVEACGGLKEAKNILESLADSCMYGGLESVRENHCHIKKAIADVEACQ